jgi:hypothetical protein
LKSVRKAATHLVEESDRLFAEMRDRANEGVDRAGDQVSGLRDRATQFAMCSALLRGRGRGGLASQLCLLLAAAHKSVAQSLKEAQAAGKLVQNHFSSEAAAATDPERT